MYFLTMLNDCQKYALAINAKETPFPTEPLIMALLLTQHKMISWLSKQVKPKHIQSNKFGLECIFSKEIRLHYEVFNHVKCIRISSN
jgi:hypothetical protein